MHIYIYVHNKTMSKQKSIEQKQIDNENYAESIKEIMEITLEKYNPTFKNILKSRNLYHKKVSIVEKSRKYIHLFSRMILVQNIHRINYRLFSIHKINSKNMPQSNQKMWKKKR